MYGELPLVWVILLCWGEEVVERLEFPVTLGALGDLEALVAQGVLLPFPGPWTDHLAGPHSLAWAGWLVQWAGLLVDPLSAGWLVDPLAGSGQLAG